MLEKSEIYKKKSLRTAYLKWIRLKRLFTIKTRLPFDSYILIQKDLHSKKFIFFIGLKRFAWLFYVG